MYNATVKITDSKALSKAIHKNNYLIVFILLVFVIIDFDMLSVKPKFITLESSIVNLILVFQVIFIISIYVWSLKKRTTLTILNNGFTSKGNYTDTVSLKTIIDFMEKKIRVSSNIRLKKYVLPWVLILFTYSITKYGNINRFWDYFLWSFTILFSLLLIILKKVEFNQSYIYFNNKPYKYESIKSFNSFEINQSVYYIFTTNSKSIFKKYHITQLKGFSLFSIFKTIVEKKNLSNESFTEFIALLDEKSNIK